MNKWQLKGLIENPIKAIALSEIDRFYPSYLSNTTGQPLKIILDALWIYEEEGSLEIFFEYNCEECSRTLINSSKILKSDEEITCKYCGYENDFDPQDAILSVKINADYREFIRKNSIDSPKKKDFRKLLLIKEMI